jgi:alkanesulfonate monooxygenase SsuD/methylene tetrahydromethanopterin reductase-like flavin-dependent oxidoreductase (luciferase family)
MEMYGIDPKQAGAMVGEAIEIIMRLWASEPHDEIEGRYWRVNVNDEVRIDLGLGEYLKPL